MGPDLPCWRLQASHSKIFQDQTNSFATLCVQHLRYTAALSIGYTFVDDTDLIQSFSMISTYVALTGLKKVIMSGKVC